MPIDIVAIILTLIVHALGKVLLVNLEYFDRRRCARRFNLVEED